MMARTFALIVALFFVVAGASYGVSRLSVHTQHLMNNEVGRATFTFVDLPQSLVSLAGADLEARLEEVRNRPWTDPALCRDITAAIAGAGWFRRIDSVRRLPGGRFEIRAQYRTPRALVQRGDHFLFVDREGVRLPGRYAYDPRWIVVQGIAGTPPMAGDPWTAEDLKAALVVIDALSGESFAAQVTGVLMDNFGGRRDPRLTHVELATDRAGGRIRWGSAPGFEVEENFTTHKLAILRRNFERTGRLDAGYPVIDISTFPDRFTVPP